MWNNIVNTVLLGTGKKQLRKEDLPSAVAAIADTVVGDAETVFLQLAAITYNYRQSGVTPVQDEGITLAPAAPEERPYCSPAAWQALQTAIDMDIQPLVTYWLESCAATKQIATPEYVPLLLEMAIKEKQLRPLAVTACGKRGEWLGQLNPAWAFSFTEKPEERWQTGSLDDRRQVLTELRQQDPAQAREWLQQTWSQENAATRAELLKVMHIHLQETDVQWLESLLNDKSQKVKEEVWSLLKRLPSSGIVQAYWALLQQSLIKSGKSLQITLQLPSDKRIADSGIQLLSNTKSISDDAFIIYQLITYVPPSWWESHFNTNKKSLLALFTNFIQALGIAAIRFKDLDWLRLIIHESKDFFKDALEVLPLEEQEAYALQFLEQEPQYVIRYLSERQDEWGLSITRELLRWIAKNPYQYNRNFFDKQVRRIPQAIAGELEKLAPESPVYQATWKNTSDHILRLLACKAAINRAFK